VQQHPLAPPAQVRDAAVQAAGRFQVQLPAVGEA
jgi:hypothetical protein